MCPRPNGRSYVSDADAFLSAPASLIFSFEALGHVAHGAFPFLFLILNRIGRMARELLNVVSLQTTVSCFFFHILAPCSILIFTWVGEIRVHSFQPFTATAQQKIKDPPHEPTAGSWRRTRVAQLERRVSKTRAGGGGRLEVEECDWG